MRNSSRFRFGMFEFDERRLELTLAGKRIELGAKPALVLLQLLRHADRIVSREELIREVWSGVRVDEGGLKNAVYKVQRALSPAVENRRKRRASREPEERWIRNIHGVGYRFIGIVERVEQSSLGEAVVPRPEIERSSEASSNESALSGPSQAGWPSTSDFIDREAEFSRLRHACNRAHAGERRVVLLEGPPGIGKTRTAEELARDAVSLGFEVHVARAHEGDGAPALWPWIQVFQSWIAVHGRSALDSLTSGRLDLLSEILDTRIQRGADAYVDGTREASVRFHLLDQMRIFLKAASESSPLLIVLDDLHRADSASLDVLIFIAQHLVQARLLLVGTHRPQEPGHALGMVLRGSGAESILLAGLTRSSVRRIVERALKRDVPDDDVSRIYAASGGNPLFVSELVRTLASYPEAEADVWVASIPSRVHDFVSARISECSAPCQRLLRIACLMGPEITPSILGTVLSVDEALLGRILAEAEERDLLTFTSGFCRFVHGIVRETLHENLRSAERMQLHSQIGEALEAHTAGDPSHYYAELAHHFSASAALRRPDRAVSFALRAAEAARNALAYREAAEHYCQALRSLAFLERSDPEKHCSLVIGLGDVRALCGEPPASFQAVFLDAIELARNADLPRSVAVAAERCSGYLARLGYLNYLVVLDPDVAYDRLWSALEEVHQAPEVASDPVLHAKVLLALAHLRLAWKRDVTGSQALLSLALERSRFSQDVSVQAEILFALHLWDLEIDGLRPLEVRDELLELVRQRKDRVLELRAQAFASSARFVAALEQGDRPTLDDAARMLKDLGRNGALPEAQHSSAAVEALTAQLDGPLEAAVRRAQEAAAVGLASKMAPSGVAAAFNVAGEWFALLGGQAAWALRQAERDLARLTPIAAGRVFLARLHAELNHIDQAKKELEELQSQLPEISGTPFWLYICGVAGEVSAIVRDRPSAELLWEALHPYAGRVLNAGAIVVCRGSVTRVLGSLAAVLGRWSDAEEMFARASLHASTLRAPVLKLLTDVDRVLAFATHPSAPERRRLDELRVSTTREATRLGLLGLVQRLQR